MKTELSKIAQDLEQGKINEYKARTLLLGLLGVSGSTVNLNELSIGDKFVRITVDKPTIGNSQTTRGKIYEIKKLSENKREINGVSIGIKVDDGHLRWYSLSTLVKNYKSVD